MSVSLEDNSNQRLGTEFIERLPTPEEEEAIRRINEGRKRRKKEAELRKEAEFLKWCEKKTRKPHPMKKNRKKQRQHRPRTHGRR